MSPSTVPTDVTVWFWTNDQVLESVGRVEAIRTPPVVLILPLTDLLSEEL